MTTTSETVSEIPFVSMRNRPNLLFIKLSVLRSLNERAPADAEELETKIQEIKETALALVEEIEALSHVRSINISRGINLCEEKQKFEIYLIRSALEKTGWHQTKAAELLGINLSTLHNKMKRLNILENDFADESCENQAETDDFPDKRIIGSTVEIRT